MNPSQEAFVHASLLKGLPYVFLYNLKGEGPTLKCLNLFYLIFFPEMRDRNLIPFFYRWPSTFPGTVCLRGFLSSNMCVVVWQRMVPHSPGHGEPWSPVASAVWRLSHIHAGKRASWGKALRLKKLRRPLPLCLLLHVVQALSFLILLPCLPLTAMLSLSLWTLSLLELQARINSPLSYL